MAKNWPFSPEALLDRGILLDSAPTTLTIALDAMGGDHAPDSVVEGAALAIAKERGTANAAEKPAFRFLFFGDEAKLAEILPKYPALNGHYQIRHCATAISGEDKPSVAVRQGKGSSMWNAIAAVRDGEAAAVVSAGNTGALMAISKLLLRTLPGIYRPAICAQMPTQKGLCAMLDLGANVECDAGTLFQFAVMGNAFARAVLHKEVPSIGLLNIGSEQGKGHEILQEAYALLNDPTQGLKFDGFIEANEINAGRCDVVVTDGFTGNVALKMSEGTARMISTHIKRTFSQSIFTKLSYLVAKPAFDALSREFDPRKYNGAMFIGLNGISVKSHGGTDGYGFYHALKVAIELAQSRVNERIMREIEVATRKAGDQMPQAEKTAENSIPEVLG